MIFGLETPKLRQAEEVLELAIFQTAFDPEEIRRQMERAKAVAKKEQDERLRDARLLAKVASYSASEAKDEADAFKVALNKTRLSGLEDPWKRDA